MKKLFASILIAGGVSIACAEPVLDWTVIAFDAQGNQTKSFSHGSHGATRQQLRTLCDPNMASRFPFPPTTSAKVEVRPFANGGPQSPRILRSAEVSCEEVRSDKNALANHIPVPPDRKPAKTKETVNLWD